MKRLLITIILALIASPALAAGPATFFDRLPAAYLGTFQWKNSADIYQVFFVFQSESRDEKGEITLLGQGIYGSEAKTTVGIKAVVDMATHRIEIFESSGADNTTEFVTDGSHVGSISADLKVIETVWNEKGKSRAKGELKLLRKKGLRQ